ncbi:MAG: DUF938 domain-containing protein [Ectothiorhodospiraceae bacterium]|nr:DUF938 domain-containing protein [Ectothiorhodospiraceae bacterium]
MSTSPKRWAEACERNKGPILQVLQRHLVAPLTVLEIGSGTGQHAVHFSRHMPHLVWQPSDQVENLPGIARWAEEARLPNLLSPVVLDVTVQPWPITRAGAVYSANTAHIMHWEGVEAMFAGASRILPEGGHFFLYGPFSMGGKHNSESNELFDAALQAQDPGMGIRDLDALEELGEHCGLRLETAEPMPANNLTLVWRKH